MGRTVVTIRGRNFGPIALSNTSLGVVTYASRSPGSSTFVYTATDCNITMDHVEMRCFTTPGVGRQLSWTLNIANQSSVDPRTGYLGPKLLSLSVQHSDNRTLTSPCQSGAAACSGLHTLSTAGGDVLVFRGEYLGPVGAAAMVTAIGTSSTATVTTKDCLCTNVHQTEVHCASPAGVGTGYSWVLVVGGQRSNPAPEMTSYAAPSAHSVTIVSRDNEPLGCNGLPTAGGAIVTITGLSFGTRSLDVVVRWDGVVVTDVRVPVAQSVITFTSLPGGSTTIVSVQVSVGGQVARVSSNACVDRDGAFSADDMVILQFGSPVVSRLAVIDQQSAGMDCTVMTPDGRPVNGGTTTLVISGSNFGDVIEQRLGVTNVTIAQRLCELISVSHQTIVCETSLCTGNQTPSHLPSRLHCRKLCHEPLPLRVQGRSP
jgi:hypothetical protein